MANIISKIDTKLIIPPHFKSLTGKKALEIEFKAGKVKEVPDNIAEYYTKSRPHVFRYADEEVIWNEENNGKEEEVSEEEFDAQEFFDKNVDRIEEAIQNITDRKQLFAISKFIGLTNYGNQSNERIKERIINDIKIQKEVAEKN